MEICEEPGCGLEAKGICTNVDCGRRICERHITIGGRSTSGRWDNRIAVDRFDLATLETFDDQLVLSLWRKNSATLCSNCRNTELLAHRDDFVVAAHGLLPDETVAPVRRLRRLRYLLDVRNSWSKELVQPGQGLDIARTSEVERAGRERAAAALAALEPELLELGAHSFAHAWVAEAQQDGQSKTSIDLRQVGGWYRSSKWGWIVAKEFAISEEADWYVPKKTAYFSGGKAEFSGSYAITRWQRAGLSNSWWPNACKQLVSLD